MKLLLHTHDNTQQFIRFESAHMTLWIEVFERDTGREVAMLLQENTEKILSRMPQVHSDGFFYADKYYLFIVLEAQMKSNITIQSFEKKLANRFKRLVEWYKYAHLVPVTEE